MLRIILILILLLVVQVGAQQDTFYPGWGTWENEYIVPVSATKVPAGSPPGTELEDVGASGDVQENVLAFGTISDEEIFVTIHAPPDIDSSQDVVFVIMWRPDPNWTSGNYMWALEFIVKEEEDVSSATGAPTTIKVDVTPDNADDYIETEFASTIDLNKDQVLIARFYRDTALDDADDDGLLRFFEIEYMAFKIPE